MSRPQGQENESSPCVTHNLCVRFSFVCLRELFLQFCVKSRKANFCLIRQHAHTPGRLISPLYAADVKGLTELRAAVTLITASGAKSKSQPADKHTRAENQN